MNDVSDSTLPAPGLMVRLAAMVYDAFLLFAIWWAVTAVAVGYQVSQRGEDAIRTSGEAAAGGPLLFSALIASILLFYGWFWRRSGQTLGMQAWRLRLESIDGGRPSWLQVVIRLIGAELSLTCFAMGYVWILFDPQQRAWHDIWSKTRLVRLPKPAKKTTK